MDINVVGRHIKVSDRFRRHVEEKLDKINQITSRADRAEVVVSQESHQKKSDKALRIEITVHDGSGNIVRAEACADDDYGALDIAYTKLMERLRRAVERRKAHHTRKGKESVRRAVPTTTAPLPHVGSAPATEPAETEDSTGVDDPDLGESPVVIRSKSHNEHPISLDDALYRMEAVGHDFYLYIDAETSRPNVVYRRKGWSYGVIELIESPAPPDGAEQHVDEGARVS